MVRKSCFLLQLPCLNIELIKTESVKTIESILRDGLGTIPEEPELLSPSPSPRLSVNYMHKTTKSQLSAVVSASLTTVANSYVRLMNSFMYKGNLSELAMFQGACAPEFAFQAAGWD